MDCRARLCRVSAQAATRGTPRLRRGKAEQLRLRWTGSARSHVSWRPLSPLRVQAASNHMPDAVKTRSLTRAWTFVTRLCQSHASQVPCSSGKDTVLQSLVGTLTVISFSSPAHLTWIHDCTPAETAGLFRGSEVLLAFRVASREHLQVLCAQRQEPFNLAKLLKNVPLPRKLTERNLAMLQSGASPHGRRFLAPNTRFGFAKDIKESGQKPFPEQGYIDQRA